MITDMKYGTEGSGAMRSGPECPLPFRDHLSSEMRLRCGLSFDPHRDGRLPGRKRRLGRIARAGVRLAAGFAGGEDAAQQTDLEQDGGEGVKRGGVSAAAR
jgi:hypothetical protein